MIVKLFNCRRTLVTLYSYSNSVVVTLIIILHCKWHQHTIHRSKWPSNFDSNLSPLPTCSKQLIVRWTVQLYELRYKAQGTAYDPTSDKCKFCDCEIDNNFGIFLILFTVNLAYYFYNRVLCQQQQDILPLFIMHRNTCIMCTSWSLPQRHN